MRSRTTGLQVLQLFALFITALFFVLSIIFMLVLYVPDKVQMDNLIQTECFLNVSSAWVREDLICGRSCTVCWRAYLPVSYSLDGTNDTITNSTLLTNCEPHYVDVIADLKYYVGKSNVRCYYDCTNIVYVTLFNTIDPVSIWFPAAFAIACAVSFLVLILLGILQLVMYLRGKVPIPVIINTNNSFDELSTTTNTETYK